MEATYCGGGVSSGAAGDIFCTTRTGKRVHIAWSTGASTMCGVWLKTSASAFKLDAAQVRGRDLCGSCVVAACAMNRELDEAVSKALIEMGLGG